MKAYKGFTKKMTCYGGFQYEEGKSYHEDNAKLCDHGFHACEIRDDKYKLIGMATAVVDGKNIKPNTWYKCVDGKFVELEDAND